MVLHQLGPPSKGKGPPHQVIAALGTYHTLTVRAGKTLSQNHNVKFWNPRGNKEGEGLGRGDQKYAVTFPFPSSFPQQERDVEGGEGIRLTLSLLLATWIPEWDTFLASVRPLDWLHILLMFLYLLGSIPLYILPSGEIRFLTVWQLSCSTRGGCRAHGPACSTCHARRRYQV